MSAVYGWEEHPARATVVASTAIRRLRYLRAVLGQVVPRLKSAVAILNIQDKHYPFGWFVSLP